MLVSFNGKSFDWNLLLTRFTANRMRVGIKDPIHVDLLYPARAIWKHKLESCRLSSLEENILGIKRHDDIPGALIPEVYFRYLSDRNASDLKKVIIHNENDVISMVSLMLRISSLLYDPLGSARGLAELYGTGNIFDRVNDYETAIKCYFCCINSKNAMLKEMSLKRLIRIYKKNRDYQKAIEFLEMLLNESKLPNIPIMIELAKQYEHRVKNITKALEIVRSAIELCHRASFSRNLYYSDLKTRAERLERKINSK
ncbi:MAG TPA: ribonuclease H-like domain-containing protein [Clostridia bacterium]|nr:ribonuclease H-like domain-containing protein [Clostridia bacterium]